MANKSTSIKMATDKELDELLIRLRKENELQRIIYELKRGSASQYDRERMSYDHPEISTEAPVESLYHFGIPGMHWGHRKGKTSTDDDPNNSADHKRKNELKKRKLSTLSNTELKELNTRLGLEKQYKELNKTEISKGKKIFMDLVGNSGKALAADYIKKYMKDNADTLFKKTAKETVKNTAKKTAEEAAKKASEEFMKKAAKKAYEDGVKKYSKQLLLR